MDEVAELSSYMWDIKGDIKEQYYIEIMNKLQGISKVLPPINNKKHVIRYNIKTYICYIDNNDEYKDIKKDIYYESAEIYNESDESPNEDYERIKEITTDCHFYCWANDRLDYNDLSPIELLNKIGESKKHTADYFLNPNVFTEHLRQVNEYYTRYLNEWDDWVRLYNDSSIVINEISYIDDEPFI
tara:strand:- start:340 stop:897 length:558 start_codon:yes stop_codon:yes gene_type:complete